MLAVNRNTPGGVHSLHYETEQRKRYSSSVATKGATNGLACSRREVGGRQRYCIVELAARCVCWVAPSAIVQEVQPACGRHQRHGLARCLTPLPWLGA